MKIKREGECQVFQPFNVVISVETKRDLEVLWCLTNPHFAEMAKFLNQYRESGMEAFSEDEPILNYIQDSWEIFNNELVRIKG